MATDYIIPIAPQTAQNFLIQINGTTYGFNFYFDTAPFAGWVLDISDSNWTPLVQGIPLVTGSDLLAQYGYLLFGFKLFCYTAGSPWLPPTWQNFGQTAKLIAEY